MQKDFVTAVKTTTLKRWLAGNMTRTKKSCLMKTEPYQLNKAEEEKKQTRRRLPKPSNKQSKPVISSSSDSDTGDSDDDDLESISSSGSPAHKRQKKQGEVNYRIHHFEVSAKSGAGVKEAFDEMISSSRYGRKSSAKMRPKFFSAEP